jgi:molecular chaperone DnaK
MIERNTTIPTKKSQIFSTYADQQTAVDVKVLQGERPMAKDNKMLGNFRLDGIPPAQRGVPQIEVTFDIDANGILHVSAVDKGTGKEQKISITNASGLNEEEINKMKEDAEKNAEADKLARETAETRNQLDSVVFSTERLLNDNKDKFSESEQTLISGLVKEGKEALESGDGARMKAALESINSNTEMQQAVAKMYQQQAEAQGAAPGADAGPEAQGNKTSSDDDNVVDAEVEDVEEEKK